MGKITARIAVLAFVVAAAHVASHGATVRQLNLEMLIARSERVIHGRVVSTRSFWDAETRTIWTETELRVLDCAKGPSSRTVIVTEPGGVVGNVGHLFPGIPQFRVDDEVVVFLHPGPGNRLRVTGLHQGVYSVTKDPVTGQPAARPLGTRQAEIVYEQGTGPAPDQRTPDAYRLVDFLQEIRQRAR